MTRSDLGSRPWISTLQRFVEDLRARGLAISQAEMIDAVRAAREVGPEQRSRLRSALSMTLAKDRRSQGVFDESFEAYFAPPRTTGEGNRGERGGVGEGDGKGSGTGRPTSPSRSQRPPSDDDRPPPAGAHARASATRAAVRRALRPLDRREIQSMLGTSEARKAAKPRRSGNDRDRVRSRPLREERPKDDRSPTRLRRVLGRDGDDRGEQERLAATARRSGADHADARRLDLAGPLAVEDEKRLGEEIPRILREMRLRRGRRKRRAARGRVWMKRVIRESLKAGGVPFRLPVHERIPRPPRIVLLVDVSHSVARAAGLFLRLALDLLEVDRHTRVFVFVNHPVEATETMRTWMQGRRRSRSAAPAGAPVPPVRRPPGTSRRFDPRNRGSRPGEGVVSPATGMSFAEAIREIPGLDPGAASDYGRAFYALSSGALRRTRRDTILVVLGDGRTNVYDPLPWAFEEIASRAKRVLWLAPEPRRRWGTEDSALPAYLRSCDVAVEITDLEGLAHGVRELIASL